MDSDFKAVLERLEKATEELHQAALAAFALATQFAAETERKAGDDREWARFPKAKTRCKVSGWSRSTIDRRSKESEPAQRVETKTVGGSRYYSLADVRKLIESLHELQVKKKTGT